MNTPRYRHKDLIDFATGLLLASGLNEDKAHTVADILVEGDLMGHNTHGLAQLPGYLAELESGSMCKDGDPEVIADFPAAITWHGRRLPGPWLVMQGMQEASQRARIHGTCTVVIRRSHHIACLAAYLKRATDQGLAMILLSSDANSASVAPFGGLDPVFTPNPIAMGFPTDKLPVLVDVSASITTNGMTNRLHHEGKLLPGEWVMDGHGNPSRDPGVLFQEPKGTILPLGGIDVGHKGYGLTLMVEALTGGLAGFGRADPRQGWGATVYLQMIDPRAFAGLEAFTRQTGAVADACHASRPRSPGEPVRTPGERGLLLAERQKVEGIALYESILPALAPWGQKLKVSQPAQI